MLCCALLLVKSVLATFERGLSRRMFGDTPTSPVVSLDLLRELLTDLLKALRSTLAISSDFTLVMHLLQTNEDKLSSGLTGMSRRSEILLGHPCSEDLSLNNLVILLAETFSLHSLHVLTAVDIAAHTKKLMRSCCPYEVPMRAR